MEVVAAAVVTVEKVGPTPFNKDGTFAKVMTSSLLERRPEWTAAQVEEEVRHRWSLWVDSHRIPRQGQVEEAVEVDVAQVKSFGFARTDGKTWFPATKQVEVKRAGRVQVVFMRTGEAMFVPEKDWKPYTAEVALELINDKVANRGGFRDALKEMREAMRSAEEDVSMPGTSATAMGMARTIGGEFSNQKLSAEKRFNKAAFKAKIYLKSNGKFGCKNCPNVTLSFDSVARRHARVCGERPSVPQERSTFQRHICSADECTARFASLRELHCHYKSAHPDRRPIKCPPCGKTFKCSDSHKRHMKEKHSVGKKFSCTFCKFTTARNCELGHHIKRSHKDEYDLLNAEDDETDSEKVDGQEVNIEEDSQEKENGDQDDDEEVEEIGILGRLQNQIRELRK